ncbi:MAG: zf-HC2 domain-containing protein [Candidatus Tectimicrobiota bacterium]
MPEAAVLPSCRAIQEGLPWYLTATLSDAEMLQVLQHLAVCADCSSVLLQWQAMATMLHLAADTPPDLTPSSQSYARLQQQIEALAVPAAGTSGWWQRWRSGLEHYVAALRAAPRSLRWTLATTSLAVLLLGSLLLRHAVLPPGSFYHTLAQPDTPSGTTALPVRLVLADDLRAGELRTLLLQVQATLVAGPSTLGVYTLHLQPETTSGLSVAQRLEILRAHPQVRLAERLVTP